MIRRTSLTGKSFSQCCEVSRFTFKVRYEKNYIIGKLRSYYACVAVVVTSSEAAALLGRNRPLMFDSLRKIMKATAVNCNATLQYTGDGAVTQGTVATLAGTVPSGHFLRKVLMVHASKWTLTGYSAYSTPGVRWALPTE